MALIGISGKINSGKDTCGRIIQHLTDTRLGVDKSTEGILNALNGPYRGVSAWEIKKFAHKIKQVCSILTGIPIEDFEKPEVKDRLLGEGWDREPDGFQIHNKYVALGGSGIIISNPYYHDLKVKAIRKESEVQKKLKDWIKEYSNPTVRWLLQTVGTEAMRDRIHPDIWTNALFADHKYDELTDEDGISKPIFPNWIITDVRFPNEIKAIKDRGGPIIRINRGKAPGVEHLSETALDNARFDHVIENDGNLFELVDKIREILIAEKNTLANAGLYQH